MQRKGLQFGIYVELAVVVLLWGLVPLVMKTTALKMQPATFNLLRFALATILLGGIFYREIRTAGTGRAMLLMLLGAFTLFPFSYFFLVGVKFVDISVAGIVQGTVPAMTVIISALLIRTMPNRTSLLSVGVAYCGLLLFLLYGTQTTTVADVQENIGIMYLLLSMLCFSLYTVLSKRINVKIRNSVVIFYASVGAMLGSVPMSIYEYLKSDQFSVTWPGIAGIAYMALFATAVSFIMYTRAVRSIGPYTASIFTNFVPIVIILSGLIALGERLTAVQFLAIIIVMVGVMLSIIHERSSMLAASVDTSA